MTLKVGDRRVRFDGTIIELNRIVEGYGYTYVVYIIPGSDSKYEYSITLEGILKWSKPFIDFEKELEGL